jgi:hypothetical protein
VEVLRGVDHFIVEAHIELLVLGVTGVDAVNEGVAEDIVVFDPSLEALSKLPKVGILKDALFEVCAVFVDKLAGKEYKSRKSEIKALFEKLSKLAGEGFCRAITELVVVLEADACLGGVRDDKSEIGVFCKGEICIEVIVGLDATGDNVDLFYVNSLTAAAEVGIFAILSGQHIAKTLFDGLNYYYAAVKICFFVDDLNHPIGKAAEKTALAELYNSFLHN